MSTRSNLTSLDFFDRFELAQEACTMRYEQRGGFLSDSDVLDIADTWTTDPSWDDLPTSAIERPDRDALADRLFDWLTPDFEGR